MTQMIIAVDPGREKCGIAVVHKITGAIVRDVVPTDQLTAVVEELLTVHNVRTVVIGDGTSSQAAKEKLKNIRINEQGVEVILVNEGHSTDEARKRYWQENPPRGLMKFIPVTMQVPPKPVDDYVAVILAERYFYKK